MSASHGSNPMPADIGRVIIFLVLTVGAFAMPISAAQDDGKRAKSGEPDGAKKALRVTSPAGSVEVRFADDSKLKLVLADEPVHLKTAYGHLLIPVGDIRRIQFATRISDAIAARIEKATADLGNTQFWVREQASAELLQFGQKAYPAILAATKQTDLEVKGRAEKLLDALREAIPEDLLEFHKQDVIYTEDSKIAGQIEATALKARTYQFGEVQLKLADMHSLRSLSAPADHDSASASTADPGNLTSLQNQIGKKFAFKVTGSLNGSVWGTGVYTADSSLATAAVHAGVLRPGQTGQVIVKIVPPPPAFLGSLRHNVNSMGFGPFSGAFEVLRRE
jgi:hypothetical protein